MDILFDYRVEAESGRQKRIRVCHGNLCKADEEYDIVVCSAFKNNYEPVPGTLIGSFLEEKNISIEELAVTPEINLKKMGCWLSKEMGNLFKRIMCVELIDLEDRQAQEYINDILLKKSFSTFKFLLEQAAFSDIPVKRVALPFLGTGNQGIELCYIVTPLINQCVMALETIDELEEITFYELDRIKAEYLQNTLATFFDRESKMEPQVFISYSSKQTVQAMGIREALQRNHVMCWMAPDSIPTGSSYQEEIPIALNKVPIVVVLLSEQAEKSRWVQKEIGTAIGANRLLVPCRLQNYNMSQRFQFLLDGEQILSLENCQEEEQQVEIVKHVMDKIKMLESA